MSSPEEALQHAMRAWSVESLFFQQAVAERLGMGATDFACLTVLLLEGPLGAGALGERSGLTSGAVTGLVDRLERAGWVRRVADPADRRRVIVEPRYERASELRPLLHPMLEEARALHGSFGDEDLAAVERYVRAATELLGREVTRLRSGTAAATGSAGGRVTVPRPVTGAGERAVLVLNGLAADLQVRTAILPGALCAVEASHGAPSVSVSGNVVTVGRRRSRWVLGASAAQVALADDLAWSVEIRGGASRLDVDLGGARLEALEVRGGASSVDIRLPRPLGTVPVRIEGGASRVALTRPAGVPVWTSVRGGFGHVVVDGVALTPSRGRGGPDGAGTHGGDGYEIEIRGGASAITVGVI